MWRRAFARTLGNPGLVLLLAVAQLLAMELTSRPLSAVLGALIDRRPAAAALVAGDDGLMLELADAHRELASLAAGTAPFGWLLAALAGWLVAGAAVRAVFGPREGVLTSLAAAASPSLRVAALGVVFRLPALAGGFAGWLVFHPEDVGSFGHAVAAGLAALAMLTAPWALTTVILDYARAVAVAGAAPTARRALAVALRLAWSEAPRTLGIAAVNSALFVAVVVATHLLMQLSESRGVVHFGVLFAAVWLRASVSVAGVLCAADVALEKTAPAPP